MCQTVVDISTQSAVSGKFFMIFVYMLYDASRSVVDVSTLSAGTGDVFMIFVHMIYGVCRGVVDVSTLSAVSGVIFMIFVSMVYDVCLAKMQKYFQKGVISWVYLRTWKISVSFAFKRHRDDKKTCAIPKFIF